MHNVAFSFVLFYRITYDPFCSIGRIFEYLERVSKITYMTHYTQYSAKYIPLMFTYICLYFLYFLLVFYSPILVSHKCLYARMHLASPCVSNKRKYNTNERKRQTRLSK